MSDGATAVAGKRMWGGDVEQDGLPSTVVSSVHLSSARARSQSVARSFSHRIHESTLDGDDDSDDSPSSPTSDEEHTPPIKAMILPSLLMGHAARNQSTKALLPVFSLSFRSFRTPSWCSLPLAIFSAVAFFAAATFISYYANVSSHVLSAYAHRFALDHAKGSNVVIVGLAHNIAPQLAASLPVLDAMRPYFNSTRVIIYENDSTDDTKAVLNEWYLAHPARETLTVFLDTLNEQSANSLGGFSQRRFDRLAAYRNRYMEVLARAEYANVDYVIVMDLDLHRVAPDAVLATMTPEALSRNWAAVGAFGTRWKFGLHVPAPIYYDTLAFRNAQFRTPFTYEQRQAASWWLYKHQADGWLPAASLFGGQVIYRYQCMAQCRYAGGDCEHVALYDCMRKTPGCGNFFVAPEYSLSYGLF